MAAGGKSSVPHNLLLRGYVLALSTFCMGAGLGNSVILASTDLITSGHLRKESFTG